MQSDFKEFFNINRLSERQLGEIEYVLNSPAFEHSFKPYMLGVIREMNRLWRDRSQERQAKYTDDFLAGGVVYGEGLMEFFDRIITETNMERIHEASAGMHPDQQYTRLQNQGALKPVVGFDQAVLPGQVPPEEDY